MLTKSLQFAKFWILKFKEFSDLSKLRSLTRANLQISVWIEFTGFQMVKLPTFVGHASSANQLELWMPRISMSRIFERWADLMNAPARWSPRWSFCRLVILVYKQLCIKLLRHETNFFCLPKNFDCVCLDHLHSVSRERELCNESSVMRTLHASRP